MITELLVIVLISQMGDDVDFGAFSKDTPKAETIKEDLSAFSFPAQILPPKISESLPKPKKDKVYIKSDKFGKRWQSKDEKVLDDYINSVNQKPFALTDKFGQTWEHQDKKWLEEFIDKQNKYYDQQQSSVLQPPTPNILTNYATNLNCTGFT